MTEQKCRVCGVPRKSAYPHDCDPLEAIRFLVTRVDELTSRIDAVVQMSECPRPETPRCARCHEPLTGTPPEEHECQE